MKEDLEQQEMTTEEKVRMMFPKASEEQLKYAAEHYDEALQKICQMILDGTDGMNFN